MKLVIPQADQVNLRSGLRLDTPAPKVLRSKKEVAQDPRNLRRKARALSRTYVLAD